MTEKPTWPPAAFAEFKSLVADINAKGFDNPRRPIARTKMRAFEAEHGKDVCAAMFAEIERRDEENRKARKRK